MVAVAAQPFGEADRELALAAEARDRLAQLLDAREAGVVVADLDIEADHARIVGGLPQQLDGFRRGRAGRATGRRSAGRSTDSRSAPGAGRATAPWSAGSGLGASGPVATKTTMPAIASSVTVPMVASRPTMNRRMARLLRF